MNHSSGRGDGYEPFGVRAMLQQPIDQASEVNLEGYPPRLLRPQGCFFVTPDRRSLVALIVGTITAHATHPDATESPGEANRGKFRAVK